MTLRLQSGFGIREYQAENRLSGLATVRMSWVQTVAPIVQNEHGNRAIAVLLKKIVQRECPP
ncbi:MAG: hypothetical protein U1D30_05675 [Planctomycetota bacterium]